VFIELYINITGFWDTDLIQVPVDPLPEDRARRAIDRIDLLNKIREEIIRHEKLDERLKLALPSLDMPEWWIPGKHDKDLLIGAVR
jgi:chromodomain-helicase-DNA-binding protein 7